MAAGTAGGSCPVLTSALPPVVRTAVGLLVLALLLVACAKTGQPPVAERSPVFGAVPDTYEVRRGDTLYSVAWRFGLDHRTLARANDIAPPYTIYVGQRLTLRAPSLPRPTAPPPAARTEAPPAAPAPTHSTSGWRPPTTASVQRGYGNGNRGIDYRLDPGHAVVAAGAGEVVYAGSGLGGFRHLVIVKHDPRYLSAYGFDRALAVREGETIKAGALLADKEGRGRGAGTLHFEIRRDGDPVDPRPLIRP